MQKKIITLFLSFIILQSCNLNTEGTWKNENIDRRKREEIKALNGKLFQAIRNKDAAAINVLFSDSLKLTINVDEFIARLNSNFKLTDFRVMDEYDMLTEAYKKECNLSSNNAGINDYEIKFTPLNKEAYTSLVLSKEDQNEFLFLIGYGKYKEEWKINMLYMGQYSLFGKTAPDYYLLAKESYEKSNFIDAANNTNLALQLLKMKTGFFQFKKEKEINQFFEKSSADLNKRYTFPMILNGLQSKPEIYNISVQSTSEGIFPMISYKSVININDEQALKNENEQVKKEIAALFPEVNQHNKYIFYMVANALPTAGMVGEQYGFVDTLSVK